MLLNYYAIAAAVVTGAISGRLVVTWVGTGMQGGRIVARAAGSGLISTLILSWGALFITGLDGFTLIHVAYVTLTVGVPLAGAIVLLFARTRPRALTVVCLAVQLAIPMGIYATHIEPFWLRVDVAVLPAAEIDAPIRIGVISDLQTTAVGAYENEAVDRLLDLAPDIIVIPGDLYQFDHDLFDERAPQFTRLIRRIADQVPYVFLVSGNTDAVGGLRQITARTGATVLDNEIAAFELKGAVVHIGGTTLFGDEAAAHRMARRLTADGQADLRILLAHKPDGIALVQERPVDLLIAGHTHGGQVSIPLLGPPLTLSSVPRHIAADGLHELHGTPIYVSTGVGRERGNAPQLRFGVRPSIGIIDVVGTNETLEN